MKRDKILVVSKEKSYDEYIANQFEIDNNLEFKFYDEKIINEFELVAELEQYHIVYLIIDTLEYDFLTKIKTIAKICMKKNIIVIGFIIMDEINNLKQHIKNIVGLLDTTLITTKKDILHSIKSIFEIDVKITNSELRRVKDNLIGSNLGFTAYSEVDTNNKISVCLKNMSLDFKNRSNGMIPKKIGIIVEVAKSFDEDETDEFFDGVADVRLDDYTDVMFKVLASNEVNRGIKVYMYGSVSYKI